MTNTTVLKIGFDHPTNMPNLPSFLVFGRHTFCTRIWPCVFANYFGADEILPVPFRDYFISAMKHLYKEDPGTFKKSGFIRIHVIILVFFDRHLSSKNPHGFPPPFEAPSVVEASCKRAMTWGAMKHNHGALVCDQVTGDSSEQKPWSVFVIRGICSIYQYIIHVFWANYNDTTIQVTLNSGLVRELPQNFLI